MLISVLSNDFSDGRRRLMSGSASRISNCPVFSKTCELDSEYSDSDFDSASGSDSLDSLRADLAALYSIIASSASSRSSSRDLGLPLNFPMVSATSVAVGAVSWPGDDFSDWEEEGRDEVGWLSPKPCC